MSDVQKLATGLLWTLFAALGVLLGITYAAVVSRHASEAAMSAGAAVLLAFVIGSWFRQYVEDFK